MPLIKTKICAGFYQVKPHKYSMFYANVHKRTASRRFGWTYDIRDKRNSSKIVFESAAGTMAEVLEYLQEDFAERYDLVDEAEQRRAEEIELLLEKLNC